MVSPMVYHCQDKGFKFPSYEDPRVPPFDDGESWTYGTWKYGGHVYDRIAAQVIAKGWGSKLTSGSAGCGYYIAIATDLCTEDEGWDGENGGDKWKYYLTSIWGNPNDDDIVYTQGALDFFGVTFPISQDCPIATHWLDYQPNQDKHCVPCWGYYTSGGNWMKTWNLIGEAYDVIDVEHPSTSEHDDIYGLYPTPPDDPGIGPWVRDFNVKQRWGRAELGWRVSTKRDVKGFNLYREDTRGNLHRVNDVMIRHDREDEFSYNYTDRDFEKGRPYVLEVVRYTPDDVKTLIHQRELIQ
jgi:hypothetical protein